MKRAWRRVALFLGLLWRPTIDGTGRISPRTAWAVATLLYGRDNP